MSTEEIDLVDEILDSVGTAEWNPPKSEAAYQSKRIDGAESATLAAVSDSVAPKRRIGFRVLSFRVPSFRVPSFRVRLHNPLARVKLGPRARRVVGAVLAFAVGAIAGFALLAAVVMLILRANANRVVPGVHVGAVDLSGLSRDQVTARLNSAYGYLGQGQVAVSTPAVPLVLSIAAPDRVAGAMGSVKTWLTVRQRPILLVVFGVVGALYTGKGLLAVIH